MTNYYPADNLQVRWCSYNTLGLQAITEYLSYTVEHESYNAAENLEIRVAYIILITYIIEIQYRYIVDTLYM